MIAKTPPMGFNTWNTFGKKINEQLIKETADAMADNKLLDAGYEYLVIDDCWSEKSRDIKTDKIIPDKVKFPNGMKAVSDYVHSKGLKFGMYSCAGVRTCGDYPGSFDHEFLDAETFAEYGCDFLKYDFCFKPESANGPQLYRRMGMALRNCGREILFSACNWGSDNVHEWIRSAGAHMYRSTGDIFDNFESFKNIALSQISKLGYSAPYCFNDMDMLTVGMYGKGNVGTQGCNDTDYRTQFSLWCLLGSPLMLGCDVRSINEQTLKLVTNKSLLKINQDPEARPAFLVGKHPWNDGIHIYMKLLSDGQFALGCFNFSEDRYSVPLMFNECGIPSNAGYAVELTDVFTGEKTGIFKEFFNTSLEKHDCAVFIARLVRE